MQQFDSMIFFFFSLSLSLLFNLNLLDGSNDINRNVTIIEKADIKIMCKKYLFKGKKNLYL